MAKCFITGVDLPLHEAYVLDRPAVHRALKDVRQQLATLERLLQQLGPHDDAEVYNVMRHETTIRRDRRLVIQAVAEVLSTAYPKEKLFLTWQEWRSRRPAMAPWTQRSDRIDDSDGATGPVESGAE